MQHLLLQVGHDSGCGMYMCGNVWYLNARRSWQLLGRLKSPLQMEGVHSFDESTHPIILEQVVSINVHRYSSPWPHAWSLSVAQSYAGEAFCSSEVEVDAQKGKVKLSKIFKVGRNPSRTLFSRNRVIRAANLA